MNVFVWSIGKYTGDYGSIADEKPLTFIGKILATLNGVLGVALFALPAGLLGAAFIEQMDEKKRNDKVTKHINTINKYFDSYSNQLQMRRRRFVTFNELQSRFLFTNDEIIEAIRKSKNLRFRAVKSDDHNRYNDIEIIERFDWNICYGNKIIHKEMSSIFIINPSGALIMGLSHLTHAIADVLKYNYLSIEKRINDKNGFEINPWYYDFFDEDDKDESDLELKMPKKLKKFMTDIDEIDNKNWVFVFCSSNELIVNIDFEYGNQKGSHEFAKENSTINDEATLRKFESTLNLNINKKEGKELKQISHNNVGNFEMMNLGKAIHKICGANVLTIYINSSILSGNNEQYNHILDSLINSFKTTFKANLATIT